MKEMLGESYRVPGTLMAEAEACIIAGKDGEVLSYCERYLAYHPTDAEARWYRAVALHRLGRKDEAEQQFKEVSGIDTNWAEVVRAYPKWLKSDARWAIAPEQTSEGDAPKAAHKE
jgi:Flp pilus assembly protein TadD